MVAAETRSFGPWARRWSSIARLPRCKRPVAGRGGAEPETAPGGMRVPDDRILYPPAAPLAAAARSRTATLEDCEVAVSNRRVQTRDGWTACGLVIVAGGFTSARLLPGLRVEPRKGHLVISDRAPGFARHQLVELGYLTSAHGTHDGSALGRESVAFNLQPRATGQMLLGSSREFVGFDESINARLRDRMIRRALEYMPALAGLSAIRTWIGFRPCTPDNLPLIGAWGETPGLLVATGHERASHGGTATNADCAGRRGPPAATKRIITWTATLTAHRSSAANPARWQGGRGRELVSLAAALLNAASDLPPIGAAGVPRECICMECRVMVDGVFRRSVALARRHGGRTR